MISSLWTGISGLDVFGEMINTIGNNIANLQTEGFKADTVNFGDLLTGASENLPDPPVDPGLGGSLVLSYQTLFTQGSLTSTEVATDISINGNGFFRVDDEQDNVFYTRASSFVVDEDGTIRTQTGLALQGFSFDPVTETYSEKLSDIVFDPLQFSKRTSEFRIEDLRLDFETPEAPTSTLTVYDDVVGSISDIGITFDKLDGLGTGDDPWRCRLTPSTGTITNLNVPLAFDPPIEPPLEEGEVAIDFYFEQGALTGVGQEGLVDDINFDLDIDGDLFNITWSLVDPDNPDQFRPDEILSTTLPASSSGVTQDGYDIGEFESFSVDQSGTVFVEYDNDNPNPTIAAQIAVNTFPSNYGLRKVGETLFRETPESGAASPGTGKTGGRGTVLQYTVEESNVNLSDEFVRLIITQRAFNASAAVISTSDQILQTAIQMKTTT